MFSRPTLAPVVLPAGDENDELLIAIREERQDPDKNWQLTDVPDVPELESFWSRVHTDLRNDPDWYSFVDSEETAH